MERLKWKIKGFEIFLKEVVVKSESAESEPKSAESMNQRRIQRI
jgi:hypothetical protein